MGIWDYTPPSRPPRPLTKKELRARKKAFEDADKKIKAVQEAEAKKKQGETEIAEMEIEGIL